MSSTTPPRAKKGTVRTRDNRGRGAGQSGQRVETDGLNPTSVRHPSQCLVINMLINILNARTSRTTISGSFLLGTISLEKRGCHEKGPAKIEQSNRATDTGCPTKDEKIHALPRMDGPPPSRLTELAHMRIFVDMLVGGDHGTTFASPRWRHHGRSGLKRTPWLHMRASAKGPGIRGNNDPLLFGTSSIAGTKLWFRMAKS